MESSAPELAANKPPLKRSTGQKSNSDASECANSKYGLKQKIAKFFRSHQQRSAIAEHDLSSNFEQHATSPTEVGSESGKGANKFAIQPPDPPNKPELEKDCSDCHIQVKEEIYIKDNATAKENHGLSSISSNALKPTNTRAEFSFAVPNNRIANLSLNAANRTRKWTVTNLNTSLSSQNCAHQTKLSNSHVNSEPKISPSNNEFDLKSDLTNNFASMQAQSNAYSIEISRNPQNLQPPVLRMDQIHRMQQTSKIIENALLPNSTTSSSPTNSQFSQPSLASSQWLSVANQNLSKEYFKSRFLDGFFFNKNETVMSRALIVESRDDSSTNLSMVGIYINRNIIQRIYEVLKIYFKLLDVENINECNMQLRKGKISFHVVKKMNIIKIATVFELEPSLLKKLAIQNPLQNDSSTRSRGLLSD